MRLDRANARALLAGCSISRGLCVALVDFQSISSVSLVQVIRVIREGRANDDSRSLKVDGVF